MGVSCSLCSDGPVGVFRRGKLSGWDSMGFDDDCFPSDMMKSPINPGDYHAAVLFKTHSQIETEIPAKWTNTEHEGQIKDCNLQTEDMKSFPTVKNGQKQKEVSGSKLVEIVEKELEPVKNDVRIREIREDAVVNYDQMTNNMHSNTTSKMLASKPSKMQTQNKVDTELINQIQYSESSSGSLNTDDIL